MQPVYGSHLHASKLNLHVCSFIEILSHLIIRQKCKLYHWFILMTPADISICYGKKRRTRAIYKVINNLFFLYINLLEDNITYVCDSNFLYRILLTFNMALKGTVT